MTRGVTWICAITLLSSCAMGPDYVPPDLPFPWTHFNTAANIAPVREAPSPAITHWWTMLGDPELDSLVDRAVLSNPNVEIALTRISVARANEIAVLGAALPDADASAGAGRGTGTDSTRGRVAPPLTAATNRTGLNEITDVAGFDAGWELDLFGKHRRAIEAAQYETDVAIEQRRDALVSVVAEVARAYVEARGAQQRLRVVEETADRARQTLKLVRERYQRGLTNELDVTLASRQLATYRAQIPPLTAEIYAQFVRIAVLLDVPSGTLMSELNPRRPIPNMPERLKTGVPAEIIRRRPDIRVAERELAVATAEIGVAAADLFPRVAITAGGGAQNQGLGVTPVVWKSIYSVGPTLYWPILDFGTLDALVQEQKLRSYVQYIHFKDTVLSAVEEANLAITRYRAQMAAIQRLDQARADARQAVDLATQRYERGVTDFLNVLDAQRQEDELNLQYAAARTSAAVDFVALYKALGGGWEMFDELPPEPVARPAIIAAFKQLRQRGESFPPTGE
jgi:NodT family efflux transporter outer membrane factor (OMF) lipoprotein